MTSRSCAGSKGPWKNAVSRSRRQVPWPRERPSPPRGHPPMPSSICGWRTATVSTLWKPCAKKRPDSRIVVLTGYGAIATAVAAVKIGATDYLSKPADANDITARPSRRGRRDAAAAGKPDVGRPRALGTYPEGLRAVRPQRQRNRAAPETCTAGRFSASSPSAAPGSDPIQMRHVAALIVSALVLRLA